jgi:outer membrane protein TolC
LDSVGASNLQLTDKLRDFKTEQGLKVDSSVFQQRPEWRETQLNAMTALYNERKESRALIPTLNLVGYYGGLGFSKDAGNVLNFGNNWFSTGYIGLQFASPLLDFGRGHRITSQRLTREKALLQQKQIQHQISYEIAQAQMQKKQASEVVAVRQQNLALAQSNKTVIEKRYIEGRALITEILDAESLLRQAEQDLLQSIFNFLSAYIALQKACGTLGKGAK